MNQYLTNGTRSIPLAIALDANFVELGHWGPRPSVLPGMGQPEGDADAAALRLRARLVCSRQGRIDVARAAPPPS